MAEFEAVVEVMIKPSILDPQGRAIERTLQRLGHQEIRGLRVGKRVTFRISGERAAVEQKVKAIAETVLSNPVMEEARVSLRELGEAGDERGGEA